MKNLLLASLSLAILQKGMTQQVDLNEFNRQRQKISKNGLLILGSWSAANILYGSIASSQTNGSAKYFHQMNAIWNAVTLGIASFGLLAKKENRLSYAESLKKQATIEKVFLVNAGLDVAYVAGGFYLKEKAKSEVKNAARSKGYGESIILQGSALLLFDGIMYAIHNEHGKSLYNLAQKVMVSSTDNGVGVVVRL